MNRRDALSVLSAVVGGTLVVPSFVLSGCKAVRETKVYTFFTKEEIDLLEQIGETILPASEGSPGARDAEIGAFMDVYVGDCLDLEAQALVKGGLPKLDQRCQEEHGKLFLELPENQQQELLVALDIEAETHNENLQPGELPHYFSLIKGLTLFGYFSSEPGATEVLRYLPVPGKYDGNFPYKEGETAWAI